MISTTSQKMLTTSVADCLWFLLEWRHHWRQDFMNLFIILFLKFYAYKSPTHLNVNLLLIVWIVSLNSALNTCIICQRTERQFSHLLKSLYRFNNWLQHIQFNCFLEYCLKIEHLLTICCHHILFTTNYFEKSVNIAT